MTTRMTSKNTPCGLNRDAVKMIAMGTMLLNHVATVFMEPGTFLFELFVDIGYFTAITMCYFLVEGWHYTRSRRRYALRLFLFALLSQIPFSYAFSEDGSLRYSNLNMMFTLLFCFLIIWALKEIPDPGKSRAMAFFLTCCTAFCDWAFFAAVFTWLFVWADGVPARQKTAWRWAVLCFGGFTFLSGIGRFPPAGLLLYAAGAAAGVALSAVCILYLYNGKRAQRGRKFFQWFFYLFYPVHLLVLGLLRFAL